MNNYTAGKSYFFVQTVSEVGVVVGSTTNLFTAVDERRPWMHPIKDIRLIKFICVESSYRHYLFTDPAGNRWEWNDWEFPHGRVFPQRNPEIKSVMSEAYLHMTNLCFSYPMVDLDELTAHLQELLTADGHNDVFLARTRKYRETLLSLPGYYESVMSSLAGSAWNLDTFAMKPSVQ